MSTHSVSVQDAIRRGLKTTAWPSRVVIATVIVVPLLLFLGFSLWFLLLFPASVIFYMAYVGTAVRRWQIWAYEHVNDIHQLQRSAEMSGLLPRGSHERISSRLSVAQQEKLRALQERFAAEAIFVDDPSIPGRTAISHIGFSGTQNEPELALNSAGIWTHAEGFFDWRLITNERIPQVSFSRMRRPSGMRGSADSEYLFRFDHPDGCFEIPLSMLRIKVWELDLLLYIYRGRFATGQISASAEPNN